MEDDRSTGRTKVEAARADLEANVVLFKLENETAMFVNTIRKQQADILRLDTIATNISSSGEASTTTAS
jgi:predicted ATP-dependent serine protease